MKLVLQDLWHHLAGRRAKTRVHGFLKSLKIIEPPAAFVQTAAVAESQSPAAPASAGKFNWQVPAQWQVVAAGQMQVARFSVAGAGGAKVDVFVSVFDTDTGGNLANVNRWRGQIGLGAVEEKDLAQLLTPLDPAIPGAVLVDLAGADKRLVGAIVPRDGKFWFYKLSGTRPRSPRQRRLMSHSQNRNREMFDRVIKFLTSLRLTVVCLACAVVLVFLGTLAQADEGLYHAQHRWFRSFLIWWGPHGASWAVPVFPGGYLIGGVLVLNLVSRTSTGSNSPGTSSVSIWPTRALSSCCSASLPRTSFAREPDPFLRA